MNTSLEYLLKECIEEGVRWGYQAAHKSTDYPDEKELKDAMIDCIWDEIYGSLEFDEHGNNPQELS